MLKYNSEIYRNNSKESQTIGTNYTNTQGAKSYLKALIGGKYWRFKNCKGTCFIEKYSPFKISAIRFLQTIRRRIRNSIKKH